MRTIVVENGITQWNFSKAELVALLAHMCVDGTRYNLYGRGLDVARGVACATDGHRLAKVWGERVEHDRAVLPTRLLVVSRETVEQAVKIAKRDDTILIETRRAEDPVVVRVGQVEIQGRLVDADFPPYDSVFPQYDEKKHRGVVSGVNASYLADLNTVVSACPPVVVEKARGKKEKFYNVLRFFAPAKELDPFLARVSCKQNATEWAVVIMPMRG